MKNELKTKLAAYDWDLTEIKNTVSKDIVDNIIDCDEDYVYYILENIKYGFDVEGNTKCFDKEENNMKINNSHISFVNVRRKHEYPYYAVYAKDYERNEYVYISTYTIDELIEYAKTHDHTHFRAYGRLSKVTHGRLGKYEVRVVWPHGYEKTSRYKNKSDALRYYKWVMNIKGMKFYITDLETGEVTIVKED